MKRGIQNNNGQSVKCPECGMEYLVGIDNRTHTANHVAFMESYAAAKAWLPATTVWSKELHDTVIEQWGKRRHLWGIYKALEETNERLQGFTFQEWDTARVVSFQRGDGNVTKTSESGHDRGGIWIAPDGQRYHYHANWDCGMVHFWQSNE